MSQDIVRVLRIVEYTGPRTDVERQVSNSIHGEKTFGPAGKQITIRAATIGEFPEILGRANDV
jgi:hypothetical protein